MGRHRLAGPDRADFLGGVVADGEDEVHLRSAGAGEFLPAFASQPRGGYVRALQLLYRLGMHESGRMAAGAVSRGIGTAPVVENCFREDRARGIPGAEE